MNDAQLTCLAAIISLMAAIIPVLKATSRDASSIRLIVSIAPIKNA